MADSLPAYPFEAARLIGTVIEVGPDHARANLPLAASREPQLRHGERVGAGEVGEFVIVEAGDVGVFGRITLVKLPDRDRFSVETRMGSSSEAKPIGTISLLTTIPLAGGAPMRGVTRFPRVGSRVFSVDPSLVTWIADHAGSPGEKTATKGRLLKLDLANLPGSTTAVVRVTPERLFGRHCAILGATGGGKSWTLARIIERCCLFEAKVILIDATGEYHGFCDRIRHLSLGSRKDRPRNCRDVALPYTALEELDLFALLRPSPGVQAPRLRSAIKSLKLAQVLPNSPLVVDGRISKEGELREPFERACAEHATLIDGTSADFDITKLAHQIELECVWPTGYAQGDQGRWGRKHEGDIGHCTSLILRAESCLSSPDLAPVFRSSGMSSVLDEIDEFLSSNRESVLRISLRHLAYGQNVREVVANGIGRHLLQRAREGRFQEQPLVVCIDEAHQFLNKWLGDEFSRYPLDAFELIAKEGRKYSLSVCISTQRPRDIPDAVIGQMGTLLVHRLTNHRDQEVVERAAGDIDRSAVAFLPSLAPGQAVLLGIDYPIPLIIQISPPATPPDSSGPNFQKAWKERRTAPTAN
jgi:hypothetical protein